MKDTLVVGIANETAHMVTRDMSADHLPAPVLATPTMISLIEWTCMTAAQPHLDDGETTVGTHVCVSHDAGVGAGEQFTIRCRLASIDKRRLNFDVSVVSARAQVSTGTHQRAVVELARIAASATT